MAFLCLPLKSTCMSSVLISWVLMANTKKTALFPLRRPIKQLLRSIRCSQKSILPDVWPNQWKNLFSQRKIGVKLFHLHRESEQKALAAGERLAPTPALGGARVALRAACGSGVSGLQCPRRSCHPARPARPCFKYTLEMKISEVFPHSDLKTLVLVLGDFQWPRDSLFLPPVWIWNRAAIFVFGRERRQI